MLRNWRLGIILDVKHEPVVRIICKVKLKGVITQHIKNISYLECDMPDVNPLVDKKFQDEPRGSWVPHGPPELPLKLTPPTSDKTDVPKGLLTRSHRSALCRLSAAPNGRLVMHN